MNENVTRLLSRTATLQNFSVAALVASFVFLGAEGSSSKQLHFEDHPAVAAIPRDLGFVGIPTIMDTSHVHVLSGSAAILLGTTSP